MILTVYVIFVTIPFCAEDFVLIRSAWSLHKDQLLSILYLQEREVFLTYFRMMVFPEMRTPETVASELIDPCEIELNNVKINVERRKTNDGDAVAIRTRVASENNVGPLINGETIIL